MKNLIDKAEKVEEHHRMWRKIRNTSILVIVVGLSLFLGIRYYYPYGEGVKSGQLNYVVYKGVIFKTYEGKLIQAGVQSREGSIQSNEFGFSVTDKALAEKLMLAGGQTVELHYTEYFATIPWRGFSRFVVDSVVSLSSEPVRNSNPFGGI
ncbi:MAG: hypothetical protein LBN71_08180 [Tannerella sp.]|jgi:hypothetical protein|nr:hypothetical protein [Tannerella sp.]